MKKILVIAAILVTLIAVFTLSASAATYEGTEGGIKWSLDTNTGEFVLSGEGEMANFTTNTEEPWYNYSALIKKLTVKEGITSIGDYAFCFCQNMTEVSLPESLVSVGDYAFYWASSMKSFSLPSGVESIGVGCFAYCGLESFVIPSNVKRVEHAAFFYCNALKSVRVENPFLEILSEQNIFSNATLYGYKNSTAQSYAVKYSINFATLSDAVRSGKCGENATWSYNTATGALTVSGSGKMYDSVPDWEGGMAYITSVTLSSGITHVGESAFTNAKSLKSVSLPDSLVSIGDFAFMGCINLTDVTGGGSVKSIGNEAFSTCTALENITVSDSIEFVGMSAFYGCSKLTYTEYKYCRYLGSTANPYAMLWYVPYVNLTSAELHPNTKIIYDTAFVNCGELESLSIPDGIVYIGANAFTNSPKLQYTTYGNGIYLGNTTNPHLVLVRAKDADIESIETHPNTKIIYKSALSDCTALKSVTISESVKLVDDYAFQNCTSLKEITIPDNVTAVGVGVFYGCTALESATLSDSASRIGDYMFAGCAKLESLDMGEGVEGIGYQAFAFCGGLTDIVIPNSVSEIEGEAFFGCTSLESIVLGKNLKSIGRFAFEMCEKLDSVYNNSEYLSLSETDSGISLKAKTMVRGILITAAPTLGADLSMYVYTDISATIDSVKIDAADIPQYIKLRVTMNGKTVDLTGSFLSGSQYRFKFTGIAPQCIGDDIDLALVYCNGEEEVIVDRVEDYSIVKYCRQIVSMTNTDLGISEAKYAQLKTLIGDLLAYSAAAQDYVGYKTESKPVVEGAAPSEFTALTESDMLLTSSTVSGLGFNSGTIFFDSVNYLKLYFTAEDITGVTVTINGAAAEFVCVDEINHTYMVITDAIYAKKFDNVYVIKLLKNGVEAQSLTYSIKSYVYSKQNKVDSEGNPTAMAILAQRTWNYGQSAKAYAAK